MSDKPAEIEYEWCWDLEGLHRIPVVRYGHDPDRIGSGPLNLYIWTTLKSERQLVVIARSVRAARKKARETLDKYPVLTEQDELERADKERLIKGRPYGYSLDEEMIAWL